MKKMIYLYILACAVFNGAPLNAFVLSVYKWDESKTLVHGETVDSKFDLHQIGRSLGLSQTNKIELFTPSKSLTRTFLVIIGLVIEWRDFVEGVTKRTAFIIDLRSFPYYQLLSDDLVFRANENKTVTVLWQGKEIQTLSIGNGLMPQEEGMKVLQAPFVSKGVPAAGQGDVKGIVAGESAAQAELAQVRAELEQARKELDREREEHKKTQQKLKEKV